MKHRGHVSLCVSKPSSPLQLTTSYCSACPPPTPTSKAMLTAHPAILIKRCGDQWAVWADVQLLRLPLQQQRRQGFHVVLSSVGFYCRQTAVTLAQPRKSQQTEMSPGTPDMAGSQIVRGPTTPVRGGLAARAATSRECLTFKAARRGCCGCWGALIRTASACGLSLPIPCLSWATAGRLPVASARKRTSI